MGRRGFGRIFELRGDLLFYGRKTVRAVFVAFSRDVQNLRVCSIEEEKNGRDKSAQAQK